MITRAWPFVTIGLPTYNRATSYLEEALQSARSQTYPNLEIVVSDNASIDGTEALVRGIADPRIRFFRQATNVGENNNSNFCLEQARGAYFLLLHDDDVIDRDFVETCMEAINGDTTVGIVRTGTRVIDGRGTVLATSRNKVGGLSTTEFMLGWFSGKTAVYLCSTLFNTGRLKEIGGFQSKTLVFQDVVAVMKLAAQWGRADVAAAKASFRRHGHNMGSATRLDDWVEDSLFLLDLMCALVPGDDARERVRREGMAYFCRKNYRYVAAIAGLVERLRAYRLVHSRFGYTYSPIRYVVNRQIRELKRRLGRANGRVDANRISGS
jgi:glycosyltransferase involved in cell wall biosynthesis